MRVYPLAQRFELTAPHNATPRHDNLLSSWRPYMPQPRTSAARLADHRGGFVQEVFRARVFFWFLLGLTLRLLLRRRTHCRYPAPQ